MKDRNKIKTLITNKDLNNLNKKMALIYCDKDFLISKGLWNDDIRRKVAQYNTANNFTMIRNISIYDDLLFYSTIFCSLKHNVYSIQITEGDVLTIQDIFFSKGMFYVYNTEQELIDILNRNRQFTKQYLRFLKNNNRLSDSIRTNTIFFKAMVDIEDLNVLKKNYKNYKMDSETKYKFLNRFKYKEWCLFTDIIDNEFIVKYLGCFRYDDLFILRDSKTINDLITKASFKERYKLYNKLILNQNIVNETRQELKGLVKTNLSIKMVKFQSLSQISPLSVAYETINQVTNFPPLISLVTEIIKSLNSTGKDYFVFYILKFIEDKKSFVKKMGFEKWFVNLCSLTKNIFNCIEKEPLLDFIKKLINSKKYSCVLLLESVKLSGDILELCKDAHVKTFLYEDYDLKLKMEVSDKYSVLTKRTIRINPTISNLCYMTPLEIKSIDLKQLKYVVKIVQDLQKVNNDYFTIRNLSLLISSFINHLLSHHSKLLEIFKKFTNHEEDDIKVLCCSLVSKITAYERTREDKRESVCNDSTDCVKRIQVEAPQNVQQIKEIRENEDQKERAINTDKRQPTVNHNYTPKQFLKVFDRHGRIIDDLKTYLEQTLPLSRLPLPFNYLHMPDLPVYDRQGRKIKYLYDYLHRDERNSRNQY